MPQTPVEPDITYLSIRLSQEDALRFRAVAFAKGMTHGECVRWLVDQVFDHTMNDKARARLLAALREVRGE